MTFAVVARAASTASALVLVSVFGAGVAVAESEETFTFPTPDVEYLQPGCTTDLTMSPSLVPIHRAGPESEAAAGFERIDLIETGRMRVESKGCGPVVWEPGVWIIDRPVVSGPLRVVGTSGPFGNPAGTSATQTVTYGIGEREAGEITLTFFAKSRLGEVCMSEKWAFDVLTKTPTRAGKFACAIDPTWLHPSA